MCKEKIFCKICNQQTNYIVDLFSRYHLKPHHDGISIKEYYDLYIKKPEEGVCQVCGKPTKYQRFYSGYTKFCSNECGLKYVNSTWDVITETRKQNNIKKYGVDHPMKMQTLNDKRIQTNIKKYGVEHPAQNKEIRSRGSEKYRKHYEDIHRKTLATVNYELLSYNNQNDFQFKCNEGHIVQVESGQLTRIRIINGAIPCPVCNPVDVPHSDLERHMAQFIKEIIPNEQCIENNRTTLKILELDVYIPSKNIAFEFNGMYWHNELNKAPEYHLDKTRLCEEKDIHLIHIWEDDWIIKQDIIKSRIKNVLGITENKVGARECNTELIDNQTAREFYNKHHLQGGTNSKINLGLYNNEQLLSVMSFNPLRKALGSKTEEGKYELVRFCSKSEWSIMGGANKLFKYFLEKYKPISVLSYADRSWSWGKDSLYENLGFKLIGETEPDYHYVITTTGYPHRENRFKYRKDVLVNEGFDLNKTEKEIMFERGIYRIYGPGSLKFLYTA